VIRFNHWSYTLNITELNNAIQEVREALAERDRLARELDRAERSLDEERTRLRDLSGSLQKEDEDVRRLEGASLVGLFYAVMGSKETRLDQERQELLSARLKYDSSQRRVTGQERDIAELRVRINRLGGQRVLQERYETLLSEKERLLNGQSSPAARRLAELGAELANRRAEERELSEAIQAGEQAQAGLAHTVEALESASGWGTWDLLGGGMIASAVKHSKLDEANAAAQDVLPLLQRFERELADVGGSGGLQIETGGLAAFADIFIDSLLVDLLVQSRINDSLDAARGMYRRVQELLASLSKQHQQVVRRVRELEFERRGLLEQG
jgi:DNA repair exonuclease SbcCD ATPase subunit